MENFDKISCIYSRTSPPLDLVTCIWKSTKNMLNDLNSYIFFIYSCITFFFLFIYWWFTSVIDRFRAITTMEAEVAVFWIKNIYIYIYIYIWAIWALYSCTYSKHITSPFLLYCLMSCFARKFHCQLNSLCNQRNYPKEIEHCWMSCVSGKFHCK